MLPQAICQVYEYGYWAFERVWGCLGQLTDAQYTQDLGYSMGPVRNQVVHVMSATVRWVSRLQGETPPPHLPFEAYPDVATTRARWDAAAAVVLGYVRSLDAAALAAPVRWEISGRGLRGEHPRWALLLHAANHATDHRAQILAMLHTHFGMATPEQDMLFYLLEHPEPG